MNFLFSLLFFITLLSLPAQLCAAAAGKGEFTLYYINDVHGETEPCG
jgi:2',3'-cyclic-nucleotide 2'-phosphodiesterase (5'-nucleotidase family)